MTFIGQRIAYAHHTAKDPCDAKKPGGGGGGGGDSGSGASDNCKISYKPPSSFKENTISFVTSFVETGIKKTFQEIRKKC